MAERTKKVCNYCKSNVLNGTECVKCNKLFHPSCAKRVKVCCEVKLGENMRSENNDTFLTEEAYLKEENSLLKQIVEDKDIIISDKENIILLLNEKIITLEEKLSKKHEETFNQINNEHQILLSTKKPNKAETTTTAKNDSGVNIQASKKIPNKSSGSKKYPELTGKQSKDMNHTTDTSALQGGSNIKIDEVSKKILTIQTRKKCEEIINLVNNDEGDLNSLNLPSTESEDEKINTRNDKFNNWKMVSNKKHRDRRVIIGNGLHSQNLSNIRGVEKYVFLHVYRLEPKTKGEDLCKFLKPHFPEVMCEELNSKHPELYSSFKVKISEFNFESAMDPSKWPKNACVRRFLMFRKKVTTNR